VLLSQAARDAGFFGRSPERALTKVKVAVAEWFDWLESRGEAVPAEAKKFEVEVAEILRVNYNLVEAGKPEPPILV